MSLTKIERFSDTMVNLDTPVKEIVHRLPMGERDAAAPHGTLFEVVSNDPVRGRVLREVKCNTVVVGGAITALENLTGQTADWRPRTLNTIHGVPATSTLTPTLQLFGAGTGGSNLEWGSIVAPDIKQDDVINPIPIRYAPAITGPDAAKYFMKKLTSDGATNAWYLKKFSNTPVIKSYWKNAIDPNEDGTEITSDIYNSTSKDGIETFTEFTIDLNTSDFREYFEAQSQLNNSRYNTFGFYTAALNAEGTEYADVRLYSVVTFNNRDLSVPSTSSFVYRVYSLI